MRTHFNVYRAPTVSPFSFDPFAGISRVFSDLLPTEEAAEWTSFPAFDVKETPEAYVIELDVPGLKKEDIQLELKENRLSISGERKSGFFAADEANQPIVHRAERRFGKFHRQIAFGTEVAAEKVEARYEDGVLSLTVPKVEAKKPHLIAIK